MIDLQHSISIVILCRFCVENSLGLNARNVLLSASYSDIYKKNYAYILFIIAINYFIASEQCDGSNIFDLGPLIAATVACD